MNNSGLRIIPFGGLGEIGKNMMVIEGQNDLVMIDCGLQFPDADLKGVDMLVPDVRYVIESNKNVSILITHGHEDHIGALRYLEPLLDCKIYAPKFAALLLTRENKFKNPIKIVEGRISYKISEEFHATWFSMSHSIPDSMGIVLDTSLGKIVHTGDFKLDFEDKNYQITDKSFLEDLKDQNVALLMSDSTYAEIPGVTPSEDILDEPLTNIIKNAPGRCIFSTFSSLIRRIQRIIEISERYQKKVCFVGSSMHKYTDIAFANGYLKAATGTVVNAKYLSTLDPADVVIIMTGSQGEPRSALVRLSVNELDGIKLDSRDTVVLSSGVIPGNERKVSGVINKLVGNCAEVIYQPLNTVHVHGHAAADELRWVIDTVQPKYFVPVHGEHKHLIQHSKLANKSGLGEDRAIIMRDGDVGVLDSLGFKLTDKLDLTDIWVKGRRLYDACEVLQKERLSVSNSGICLINLMVNRKDVLTSECSEFGVVPNRNKKDFISDVQAAISDNQKKLLDLTDDLAVNKGRIDELIRNIIYKMYHVYPKIICNVTFS
tara:strand:+ start:440 stop:2074 length:1635 start_codon:yes stop_codon:yes gene_type:complete